MSFYRCFIFIFLVMSSWLVSAQPVQEFLPKKIMFNSEVPLPSKVLGFEIGERHLRFDQLTQYFNQLEQYSERIRITSIGKTAQQREQFLVTVSSPENLANLDNILAERRIPYQNTPPKDEEPLVIWLGYSIHGDELSGANAAMVVAYYLAASEEKNIESMLANTIIVLEPSINPDGMDRFVNWVTSYRELTIFGLT